MTDESQAQAVPQPQPIAVADAAVPSLVERLRNALPKAITFTAAPDALTEALVLANSTIQLAILVISTMPPEQQAAAWQAHEARMDRIHGFIAGIVDKVKSIGQ